jgi:hypothetical protein
MLVLSLSQQDFAFDDLQCMALDGRRRFASQFTQATAARNDDPMLIENPTVGDRIKVGGALSQTRQCYRRRW